MEATYREMDLLSRQLTQAHRAAIQSELNAAGLSKVGHPLLVSILQSAQDGQEDQCQAQQDLADTLHVSAATVTNSLKCLERDGYIHREPWQDDARRNRIILTEKGLKAVEGCREVFHRVSVRMMSGFSQEELEQLAHLQQRMLNNLLNSQPKE